MTESRTARRSGKKRDPFQPRRFGELRREIFEDGTQRHRKMQVLTRPLTQLHSLDELAQHAGQLRGRVPGRHQLLALLLAVERLRQDIVRAGDDLQRLAQIVTGHRQQGRREIAVDLVCVSVHGSADARRPLLPRQHAKPAKFGACYRSLIRPHGLFSR